VPTLVDTNILYIDSYEATGTQTTMMASRTIQVPASHGGAVGSVRSWRVVEVNNEIIFC
jgi:hypothetical protein